ncbi:MAG: PQQ-binding-like beta-propeller repeat protein [Proteobacteria bacterium]|nr:PQQ-binding-like beta-propeller repeat protein [Pseudomonadota bacterium]
MNTLRCLYFYTILCMIMGCSNGSQEIHYPTVQNSAEIVVESPSHDITKSKPTVNVFTKLQDEKTKQNGEHTVDNFDTDGVDTRTSFIEESMEGEYISDQYYSCSIKNPTNVKFISKHKYNQASLHRSKVIDNRVFMSSMEYNNWFSLDDLSEETNILRGYWGIATNEYIYSHIGDDNWAYDYRNDQYIWKEKFKGWSDVGIDTKYLYIVHELEDKKGNFYYLDKRKLNGEVIWTKKLPEFQPMDELLHLFLVWKNHIIVGMSDLFLASVNAQTGEIEWKRDYDQGQDENYRLHQVKRLNRPVFADPQNQRILFDYYGVTCIDMDNGDVLWTFDREGRRWLRILAVYEGIVYLSDLGASPLIIALDTQTGKELWRYAETGYYDFRSLFVTEDYVIFGTPTSSVLTALERKTGELAWKLDIGHGLIVGGAEHDLMCHDNKLIVAADYIYVFEVLE